MDMSMIDYSINVLLLESYLQEEEARLKARTGSVSSGSSGSMPFDPNAYDESVLTNLFG
jgi:hypothetical protein|nr:MAG TPA: hypothetical protein [Caudoviricetes sp.]